MYDIFVSCFHPCSGPWNALLLCRSDPKPPYVITAAFLFSLAYPTLPLFNVLNHKQQLSHPLKGSLDYRNAYFDDLAHLTGRKDKQIKDTPP
jgi:hypothetical protein